jgi:4'-phosphopantetheinyl transferase EntD
LLAHLLPAAVATAEAFDDTGEAVLFAEEAAVLTRAVDKRRREFTTSRACARKALGQLGLPPAPIVPGERGAPIWPAGIVGSMTHCDGYRAAAVASQDKVLTIGIDAEPNAPLPEGVFDIIASGPEKAMLRELPPGPSWDRLLFSAKESVYKAWYPLARIFLDFDQAQITFDPAGRTFAARVLVPGPVQRFAGRWSAERGLVLTAIAIECAA